MAIPPTLEELVPVDHPVRVVQDVLEKADITLLMKQYRPRGASSYHLRMLLNRFRGQRLQKTLQPIFTQVVLLLCEEGLLSLKDLHTDGTRIEANASRYTKKPATSVCYGLPS